MIPNRSDEHVFIVPNFRGRRFGNTFLVPNMCFFGFKIWALKFSTEHPHDGESLAETATLVKSPLGWSESMALRKFRGWRIIQAEAGMVFKVGNWVHLNVKVGCLVGYVVQTRVFKS